MKEGLLFCNPSFADWTGLEPATSAVTGRHSNQLNYQSFFRWGGKNRGLFFFAKNKTKKLLKTF